MQSVDNIITKAGLNQSTEDAIKADTNFGFINKKSTADQIFNPALIANQPDNTMAKAIQHELRRSDRFQFSVAFVTSSALAILKQSLRSFSGAGVIYTSTYLDFNDPETFEELLTLANDNTLSNDIEVRVLNDDIDAFHAKGYIFEQGVATTAIVGSSNLTRGALLANNEWNLRFSALPNGDVVDQLKRAIEDLREHSHLLTKEWIAAYEARRKPVLTASQIDTAADPSIPVGRIVPNSMQESALEQIKKVIDAGESRAVVVSATGTGKTILSALAARQFDPQKLLFIVHREQILDKAIQEYRRVFADPKGDDEKKLDEKFGKFVGAVRQIDRKYVFATVQSLSRDGTLDAIDPATFDLIIIDEVHRAGANTYQKIIGHFKPRFLLGLTATPERTDQINIFELFDYNVPYEIRLNQALEAKMLVPFSYFGVHDYTDEHGNTVDDTSNLTKLVADERVKHLLSMLEAYSHPRDVRGLMFCSTKKEANDLSVRLNKAVVNGRLLRTYALTGDDPIETREAVVRQLEEGELDYILTVDIFNEGIDIPTVNQVVMLRQTQSAIIFTQQLGRGLRKAKDKDHLRVIDFIGNYKNNFLIPIALFGDTSLKKENVRRKMREAQERGSIAGLSSISFDEVAQERVLRSLAETKLDSMANLKSIYREVEDRLGRRQPMRLDFATADKVHPVVIATSPRKNYWDFQHAIKKVSQKPSESQSAYLNLLDNEFLNGKRPHELLLLRELLLRHSVNIDDLQKALNHFTPNPGDLQLNDEIINSLREILSLRWFTDSEREKYGQKPLAHMEEGQEEFSIDQNFLKEYSSSPLFKRHVDDIIETGLHLNRHEYGFAGSLVAGQQYSRKDACRLLNWTKNVYSTVYGYKPDKTTNTCPIFVTYHKDEAISETTKYEDSFDSPRTLHWYTKSNRSLIKSKAERKIAEGKYALHVFVKRDDSDGSDFYYVGRGTPRDAQDETMPVKDGEQPVVSMRIDLYQPLGDATFDYLTTPLRTKP